MNVHRCLISSEHRPTAFGAHCSPRCYVLTLESGWLALHREKVLWDEKRSGIKKGSTKGLSPSQTLGESRLAFLMSYQWFKEPTMAHRDARVFFPPVFLSSFLDTVSRKVRLESAWSVTLQHR